MPPKHTIQLQLDDAEADMLAELAVSTGQTLTGYLIAGIAADYAALCDADGWGETYDSLEAINAPLDGGKPS